MRRDIIKNSEELPQQLKLPEIKLIAAVLQRCYADIGTPKTNLQRQKKNKIDRKNLRNKKLRKRKKRLLQSRMNRFRENHEAKKLSIAWVLQDPNRRTKDYPPFSFNWCCEKLQIDIDTTRNFFLSASKNE